MTVKKEIAFIGYSGHAFVCIETALCAGYEIEGYCDISVKKYNPYNLKYLGRENQLSSNLKSFFIAIGDNSLRQKIYKSLNSQNRFETLIHPKSIVSSTSLISENVLISAGAIVNAQTKIGVGCIVNTGAVIEHECLIANFAHIAPGAVIAGNVEVGERTFIGANATIKQGVKIGNDVIIGAGTVVINDIPNNCTVVGNPGKIIKTKI